MCIEGIAYFCGGGGHTLVEPIMCMLNVEYIECMMQNFRFAALLGLVLDL